VEQFERMTETGILGDSDRVELLAGYLVEKMTHHPPHATALDLVREMIQAILPTGWRLREQKPIRCPDSMPEPDLTAVQGSPRRFAKRHPLASETGLLVEIAEASLDEDRRVKGPIYARAGVRVYWIVNLIDRQVEVYTHPKSAKNAGYRTCQTYAASDFVPVVVGGKEVGRIAVADLLP